jgi:hypothetical protein
MALSFHLNASTARLAAACLAPHTRRLAGRWRCGHHGRVMLSCPFCYGRQVGFTDVTRMRHGLCAAELSRKWGETLWTRGSIREKPFVRSGSVRHILSGLTSGSTAAADAYDAEDQSESQFLLVALRARRQRRRRLKSPPCQRFRLMMGRAMPGGFRSLKKVLHGARRVVALLEMHRKFGGNLFQAIAVDRFPGGPNPTMNLRPSHRGQEPIRHIEIENVAEPVPRRDRTVRQIRPAVQARGSGAAGPGTRNVLRPIQWVVPGRLQ